MEPMTTNGVKSIREELERLTRKERPHIIEAIASARALGDLKENSEYHSAKDRQGMIEARIRDLENKLRDSQIIDITTIPPNGRVLFGSTVTLKNLDTKKNIKYQIVGDDEADATAKRISYAAPVAKSIMGKPLKEEVEVALPDGNLRYRIEKIEHI